MAAIWYTLDNDEIDGPMSVADLLQRARRGEIKRDTRVRKGEDGTWVPAERVKGLFEDGTMPVVSVQRTDTTKSASKPRWPLYLIVLMALAGLVCVTTVVFLLVSERNATTIGSAEASKVDPPIDVPIESPQSSAVAPAVVADAPQVESADTESEDTNQAKEEVSYREDLYEWLDIRRYSTTAWELGLMADDPKYSLLSPSEAAAQILKSRGSDPGGLLAKHAEVLSEFLTSLLDVGFLRHDRPPVQVWGKDGQPCLVISDVATDTAFNTRRFTKKQRAAKSLEMFVFPLLQELDEHIYNAEIPYYCVLFYYGSQDFAERTDSPSAKLSLHGEMLALIVSRDNCHAFAAGRISQEKLLSDSELFIGSRSDKPRRVEVTLE